MWFKRKRAQETEYQRVMREASKGCQAVIDSAEGARVLFDKEDARRVAQCIRERVKRGYS